MTSFFYTNIYNALDYEMLWINMNIHIIKLLKAYEIVYSHKYAKIHSFINASMQYTEQK